MPFSSVLGANSVVKPGVCTSTTRPSVPYDGQMIYETDTNLVKVYEGAAWVTVGPTGVVQVKSTTKTDTFTSASTTFVDITGVSVSITPTSASNKILVLVMLNASNDVGTAALQIQLLRDATAIGIGDAAGSRTQATADFNIGSSNSMTSGIVSFLDSPATTSATTYKIQGRNSAAGTFFVNRTEADGNAATTMRGISTITVFEVTP